MTFPAGASMLIEKQHPLLANALVSELAGMPKPAALLLMLAVVFAAGS